MRAQDLNLAALDIRRAGELLLHPCGCTAGTHRWRINPCPARACTNGHITVDGRVEPCLHCWSTCTNGHVIDEGGERWRPCPLCKPHTLGEHLLRAKRDQRPGVRATNTDPRGPGGPTNTDDDQTPTFDATLLGDQRFADAIHAAWSACQTVADLIQRDRPDRTPKHQPSTAGDDQWCRTHLALGICEPRFRGDECRWCYRFRQANGVAPPEPLLRARHDGQRITQPMVAAALRAAKAKASKGKKRKKAS